MKQSLANNHFMSEDVQLGGRDKLIFQEVSPEVREFLESPPQGQLSEQESQLKNYVANHLNDLRNMIKVSPQYLANTVRLTQAERQNYFQEIDNLKYEGLVEYYNQGWKNANLHYILWLGKSLDAIEKLGFTEQQRATAFYDFEFSDGSFTLDFCWPNPFPEHTYDEIPIIKETPSDN